MPGRKLSHGERRLADFWANPPAQFPRPLLRQIRIENRAAIRGIASLLVPLTYPITALCGRNSVGKSTVLGLAALSAKTPTGWSPYWGNTRPRRQRYAEIEYNFSDFFHRGSGDPSFDGLRVGWVTYEQGNEIDLVRERRNSRWVTIVDAARHGAKATPSRREVDFIPISRILPAADQAVLRNAFSIAPQATAALSAASIAKLSYIMGKQYQGAETRFIRGLGLPACNTGPAYSGFHMGSGECSVVVLLSRLDGLPSGGLLVVEELELGLHAEAQGRLIEVLVRHCDERKIQIVCTTHSEVVLDCLPRIARVLLRKSGGEHEAIPEVSTRFCIHEMSGEAQPELMIYTEDEFAAALSSEALVGPVRSRVRIIPVGSNVTLARQAVAHLRSQNPIRALTVFDGDCHNADVAHWIDGERGNRNDLEPDWLLLPADGLSPERWVVRELAGAPYVARLAAELNCSEVQASAHIEAIRVDLDMHDCAFTLSQRTGLPVEEVRNIILRTLARSHPALDQIRNRVSLALSSP